MPQLKSKKSIITFTLGGEPFYFYGCLHRADPTGKLVPGLPIDDGSLGRLTSDKAQINTMLSSFGVSVPKGESFLRDEQRAAESYFVALAPSHGACVKPTDGSHGRLVHVGIRDMRSFRDAFAAVGRRYKRILVEETVLGRVHRFLTLEGRVIAISLRRPANVEGDGTHTISELVELKNAARRANRGHSGTMLRIGTDELVFLGEAGLKPEDVPEAGRTVFLSNQSNLHQGAESIDAGDLMHESYVEIVERVMNRMAGLVFCGVDVAIEDAEQPATADNYHFIEINICPGFSGSQYPWSGKPRDVAGAIIDYLAKTRRTENSGAASASEVPP